MESPEGEVDSGVEEDQEAEGDHADADEPVKEPPRASVGSKFAFSYLNQLK